MQSSYQSPKSQTSRSLGALLAIVLVLVGVIWLAWQRTYVVDQLTVWQYQPSDEIKKVVARANLAPEGEFYLYASRAEVSDAKTFNAKCKKSEEHSAILGCYTSRQIFIYDIDEPQLDGIKEVTGVHEMLHAAWDRLSASEQTKLTSLLEAELAKHSTPEIVTRMEYYARTQPGERANELHSIIGSEIPNIAQELEDHYSRYLADRGSVVALHDKYESVFSRIRSESARLEQELTALADAVERSTAQYNSSIAQLNADIQSFNARASSGGFTTQASFNQERAALVARSERLQVDRRQITQSVDRHKSLLAQLEQVNSRSAALSRSIDSTLSPAAEL